MKLIRVPSKLQSANDVTLRHQIQSHAMKRYQQEAKTLQVNTVMSLLRGRDTFVLAATGFGKSRIPEMYLGLLAKDCRGQITGVVVVLNPLNALGNNQVEEKTASGIQTAGRP
ncbi:hypothetical protein PCASD_16249 [Puccinia coronata f. sp. avenae]|uniref:DNA 3'-5' helicase n=1 Tax=Puccinia coronata f. sp. avenae TaxID=200324 RepID=A0A2N5S377_9BASI|nr:hypothetical protein PCASD_22816 [Puccinia coronata f. sp. avenae]PLW29062.1 hypothetical protein PCASD_16249 [Puccinia coronata f. sp. avenae]